MATDVFDPIVIATLTQTIVLALTLIIFIFQLRSQNAAIKEAAYQKALDDYTNTISLLVHKPELASLANQIARLNTTTGESPPEMTPETTAAFGYMLLTYSVFERIHLLYSKKWIDEDTWLQWHATLKTIAKHPMFLEVHRRSQGMFDKKFQELVAEAARGD